MTSKPRLRSILWKGREYKTDDRKVRRLSNEARFMADLLQQGFAVQKIPSEVGMRPVCFCPEAQLQDVIRATKVRVRWSWASQGRAKVWPEPVSLGMK